MRERWETRGSHDPHQLAGDGDKSAGRGEERGRAELIWKKSSNLYCRLDIGMYVLMVETKVYKGFFV